MTGVGAGLSAAGLAAVVADRRSLVDLRDYFHGRHADGRVRFTGSRFHLLGTGGEDPDAANRITAADILAVGLLNVTIPGPVVLELLEGRLGEDVAELLTQIPADIEIGTSAAAVVLAPDSPASMAWTRLERTHGLGWVSATKLLARKPPWSSRSPTGSSAALSTPPRARGCGSTTASPRTREP